MDSDNNVFLGFGIFAILAGIFQFAFYAGLIWLVFYLLNLYQLI